LRTDREVHYAYSNPVEPRAMNLTFLLAAVLIGADEPKKPLFATVDLDRGEAVEVQFPILSSSTVHPTNGEEKVDTAY
jgi:hypothetical protein